VAAVAVVVVVVAGVFLAIRWFGGNDAAYQGPQQDLVVLAEYPNGTGRVTVTSWGSDDRPTPIADDGFVPAEVLLAPGDVQGDIASYGGPLVGTVRNGDEISVVAESEGEFVELLSGESAYSVSYHPPSGNVLIVEDRGDGQRCYAGRIGDTVERVGRGDACAFSPDGSSVLVADVDSDYDYEVRDLSGELLVSGSSIVAPAFAPTGGHLVLADGSAERRSVLLQRVSDGVVVSESSRGDFFEVVDITTSDSVLVFIGDEEGWGSYERLDPDGGRTEVIDVDGGSSLAFVDEDGSTILAALQTDDGARVALIQPGGETPETVVASVDAGESVWMSTPTIGRRDGTFVVVEQSEDSGVIRVGDVVNGVEIDIDGDVFRVDAVQSAESDSLFLEVEWDDDGDSVSGLLAVDPNGGEFSWIDDWSDLSVTAVSPDGVTATVVGYETGGGDRMAVVVGVDGEVEIVDEATELVGVRFGQDGRSVLYTVVEDGDVDTFEYEIGSRRTPQLVYGDASVVAAGWSHRTHPIGFLPARRIQARMPVGTCADEFPGLDAIRPGGSESGSIDSYQSRVVCLDVAAETVVSIVVDSTFDSVLSVAGPYGGTATFQTESADDTSRGANEYDAALYDLRLAPGAYEIEVSGYDSSSGTFTLSVR
jgi:hypothetical protein